MERGFCNKPRSIDRGRRASGGPFFCAVTCCGLPGDDYCICRRWHADRIIWMEVAARVCMPRRGWGESGQDATMLFERGFLQKAPLNIARMMRCKHAVAYPATIIASAGDGMPTGLSGWKLQRESACQDGGGGMVGVPRRGRCAPRATTTTHYSLKPTH